MSLLKAIFWFISPRIGTFIYSIGEKNVFKEFERKELQPKKKKSKRKISYCKMKKKNLVPTSLTDRKKCLVTLVLA